jgi:predicted Zn-dependent peptidase
MIPVGSRDENNSYKGISHFLEHMCFKGTPTRPTSQDIAKEIENLGGNFNAFTSYEGTVYWIHIDNKYKKLAKDLLYDMVVNSKISEEDVAKEKNVILQELKMYEDNPHTAIEDVMNQIIFHKESGLYLPIVGTKETLKDITSAKIKWFRNEHYNQIVDLYVGKDGKNSVTGDPIRITSPSPELPKSSVIHSYIKKDVQQANMRLSNYFYNTKYSSLEIFFGLCLMEEILNDMSGRLFSVIREKHGLVYGIGFNVGEYREGAFQWTVNLGLDAHKIGKANELIKNELTRPFTEQEISQAIKKFISAERLKMDSIKHMAFVILDRTMMFKNFVHYVYEYEKHIKNSAKIVNNLQKDINFNKYFMGAIIPKKESKNV